MAKELKHQLVVKFSREDFAQVENISEDFSLNRLEIVRVATVEGSKLFRDSSPRRDNPGFCDVCSDSL